jgi:hypothetical protein
MLAETEAKFASVGPTAEEDIGPPYRHISRSRIEMSTRAAALAGTD